jgi:hypothetical protein
MTSDTAAGVSGATSLPPSYTVKPYACDGGTTMPGVMMLVGALVVTGAVVGFIAHLVAQFFYLVLIFPVAIGFALGLVGARMVKQGRIRNPWLGGLAGFLGGTLAMLMMHHFDQQKFRDEAFEASPDFAEVAKLPPQERTEFVASLDPADREASTRALRAADSLWGFLDLQAHNGVTIGKPGRSGDHGLNLGYYGSYVYWLVELLIVAGITYGLVYTATMEPYCATCDQWKRPVVLGFFNAEAGPASAAVQSGDLSKIRNANPTSDPTSLRLTAHACDACVDKGEADLKLEVLTTNKEGNLQAKTVSHTTYPAAALPHLVTIFKQMPASPATTPPA